MQILFYFILFQFFSSLAEAKEKIAFIAHGGMGDPFWSVVFKGAKEAAKDLNADLHILFPNKDGDQAGTTQKLSEAISTHPDGIATTLATTANCEYVREAKKNGIPVVVFNARATASSSTCPYEAYIGMDEYRAGKEAGKRAWQSGRIKKRAMIGLTEAGHYGHQARAKGIADELRKKGVHVDIVDLGTDPSSIPSRLNGYISRQKQENGGLSAIFTSAPNAVHPLIRMMQDDPSGIGKLYVSTFDLTPLILKGIRDNLIDHTIDQQPYLQGYFSVAQLIMAARGGFNLVDMNTGVGIVEKSNVNKLFDLVKKNIR